MPRVTQHKKNRGGKTEEYRCQRCSEGIKPGETYYEWSFRYGGTQRQHTSHGYPRGSQLTQSKLGEVYAAAESLEDWYFEQPVGTDVVDEDYLQGLIESATSIIADARDQAESVISEYQDAIEAMPASEEQNQERIDAIEDWVGELESAESEVENVDIAEALEDDDPVTHLGEQIQSYMSDAAGSFSL